MEGAALHGNEGDYISALNNRENVISISSILYPNDSTYNGKELRLKQQYFFVSATIQDVISSFKERCLPWNQFPEYVCNGRRIEGRTPSS